MNSFAILGDDEIVSRALECGIDVNSLSLSTVHLLKDLEVARDNLADRHNHQEKVGKEQDGKGVNSVASECTSRSEPFVQDGVQSCEELSSDFSEDGFTPVLSRRTKKELRKNKSGQLKSGNGLPLSGKSNKKKLLRNHPLCDVIPGPRLRNRK